VPAPLPNRFTVSAKFLGSGSVGVLLYYAILTLLTEVLGVKYIFSAVVASVVNFGSNFVLQKFWTFKNSEMSHVRQQAGRYAVLAITLALTNLLALYVLVEYAKLWYLGVQAVLTISLTVVSYLVTRKIFAHESPV
jgi:putative flippase GtrA